MKNIILSDDDFYFKIKKYKNKKYHFFYKLNNKLIDNDKYISNKLNDIDKEKIYIIHALNIKDKRLRIIYIYDILCNYLDRDIENNNCCDFKNNKCIAVRCGYYNKDSNNGCCYGKRRGVCKYISNNKCSTSNIACKLFTCKYLRDKNIKYDINKFNLINIFFNSFQKYIITSSVMIDKDSLIDELVKWSFI